MFTDYYQCREWLESFIPQTYTKRNLGLEHISYLLKLLGNPQNKFKSIHIAGTSGKGSAAFYTARLLQESKSPSFAKASEGKQRAKRARGFKIGLHISPHLVDIRERMMILSSSVVPASSQTRQAKLDLAKAGIKKSSDSWIPNQVGNDNTLMSIGRFLRLFNEVGSIVEKIKKENPDLTPSYFEILVAASFLYFAQEKVDWAVVEVGLGGRLDATNVLKPELSIITNIGLDHTDILGKTIEKIAFEKAGIIKSNMEHGTRNTEQKDGIPVITDATGKALKVIEKVAKEKKAPLITLSTQIGGKSPKSDIKSYLTLYNDILKSCHVFFTKDVFYLSLAVASTLKIPVNKAKIIEAFSASFPGRFEEVTPGVIIDGAHNLDKIKMLVDFVKKSFFARHSRESLSTLSSRPKGGNLDPRIREDDIDGVVLVVAFKKGKDWKRMLEYLFKNLDIERCYTTQFYAVTDTGPTPSQRLRGVNFFAAVEPEEIKRFLNVKCQMSNVKCFNNSQEAVFEAIQSTVNSQPSTVLVTGSLYLAGEARTIWHLPSFA